jgi:hypothetical protein
MRLQEIFSDEEWQRLEQLIYASTYKALATYQQQRATQQRIAAKPVAKLRPQAAKKAKALARKVKQPPNAALPRPLPKPQPVPQAKAQTAPTYRPVKTASPLPPTTRMAMTKAGTQAPQPVAKATLQPSITNPNEMDQAARRMLPKSKQGQNPIDLLSLDERG